MNTEFASEIKQGQWKMTTDRHNNKNHVLTTSLTILSGVNKWPNRVSTNGFHSLPLSNLPPNHQLLLPNAEARRLGRLPRRPSPRSLPAMNQYRSIGYQSINLGHQSINKSDWLTNDYLYLQRPSFDVLLFVPQFWLFLYQSFCRGFQLTDDLNNSEHWLFTDTFTTWHDKTQDTTWRKNKRYTIRAWCDITRHNTRQDATEDTTSRDTKHYTHATWWHVTTHNKTQHKTRHHITQNTTHHVTWCNTSQHMTRHDVT